MLVRILKFSLTATTLVILLIAAFMAGYIVREWQPIWGGEPAALNGAPLTEEPVPPIQHELYQQVWNLLEQDFYGDDPTVTERVYGSIHGLTGAYGDRYTYFVEPQPRELERDRLRGSFGGIGAWIDRTEQGYVLRPMPGQPAEEAGVRAGDRLLAIDGTPVTVDMAIDAVTALERGEIGSEVCLELERVDANGIPQTMRICIDRAEIQIPSVEWRLLENNSQIGYIRQTIFSERSAQEMQQAVEELQAQGAEEFILDLRGNPGGVLDAAVSVSDLWLDEGPVLIERQSDGDEEKFVSTVGDVSGGAPLVVLVDHGSASASEILAGALRDRDRALLVGEQTFGKGSVQLVHELVDKSSLHVTAARWFTPDDVAIDGIGLTPDVVVAAEQDSLVRAVEVLNQQEVQVVSE